MKVVRNLLQRPKMWERATGTDYREVCTAYGCMRFAAQAGEKEALSRLVHRYEIILTERGKSLITRPDHVDDTVFGIVPLEMFILTASDAEKKAALEAVNKLPPVTPLPQRGRGAPRGAPGRLAIDPATAQKEADAQWTAMSLSHQEEETRLLAIGKTHADTQWASPIAEGENKGLTDQTRMWVDDMFMITGIQCQAYRATGNRVYLDRAAREMVVYLKQLQQPNGLFFHADDSHFYWGRGNGWFAVGMAELLSDLPADHPDRPAILDGYKKMMAGLLKYQATSGMWRQLIDNPQAWEETTGTGMFTFAMARGVREGWLDARDYKEPAKKAWIALSGHIDGEGNVTDACVGTNKGYSVEYYLDRQKVTGDYHGQAAYVWAAWAMMR